MFVMVDIPPRGPIIQRGIASSVSLLCSFGVSRGQNTLSNNLHRFELYC